MSIRSQTRGVGIYSTMVFNSIRDGIYVPKVRVKLGDLCEVRCLEVFKRVVGIMAKHSVYGAKCMFLAVSR
jgi:hypothetical protein